MKPNSLALVLFTFWNVLCFCQPLTADLLIAFSADGGSTFDTEFDVATGDQIGIWIYAIETSPDTVLSAEGLVSFGMDVNSNGNDFGMILSNQINPEFDFASHDVDTATGFEWEFADSSNLGVSGNSILLGCFEYQTTADGETVFGVSDRASGTGIENASWLTPALNILDEEFFGPGAAEEFQFQIVASSVPEPSGIAVLFMATGIAVIARRRVC